MAKRLLLLMYIRSPMISSPNMHIFFLLTAGFDYKTSTLDRSHFICVILLRQRGALMYVLECIGAEEHQHADAVLCSRPVQ